MSELSHIFFDGVEPSRRTGARGQALVRPVSDVALRAKSAPCNETQVDAFLVWLFQQVGLSARAYRMTTLQRRLPACLRRLGVASACEARALLERWPELAGRAVDAILIGVSEFFRDPDVFECLRSRVLPGLLRRRSGLKVLSVGCSQGQELYSLAMLLDEAGALAESDLVGVDCRNEAIARAQEGSFEEVELAGIDADRMCRYFRREGDCFRISSRLQERVRWHAGDLFSFQEQGEWDVILFRNVAIYLESYQVQYIWQRLVSQLAPGGVLVTGKSERPAPSLPLMRIHACVYGRTDG